MKRLLLPLLFLTAICWSGCSDDDDSGDQDTTENFTQGGTLNGDGDTQDEMMNVTLSLSGECDTRISIDENLVTEWVDGDNVYAVLTTPEDDGTYKYSSLTYSEETGLFTGNIYVGENRIYQGLQSNNNTTMVPTVDFAAGTYKMVSKNTITIKGDAETFEEVLNVYMQNIGAIFNFEMTFINNPADDWGNVYIQDIVFGDSSDESAKIPTLIYLDPAKGVTEEGFVSELKTYNGSYSLGKYLDSDSKGKYTFEVKTYPFTIAKGEQLKVTFKLSTDGNGAMDVKSLTTYIENNTDEDFVLERSTYSTITKTIDLSEF